MIYFVGIYCNNREEKQMVKFIWDEIVFSRRRDIKSLLLLIVLATIGFICLGMSFFLMNQTESQLTEYKEIYEDTQYYTILDNFSVDSAVNLDDKSNTDKFKIFLNLLMDSKYFEYFMMYEQPVYLENYIGDESNIYGYEHTSDLSNMTLDIVDRKGDIRESTNVKAFWIGNNVIDYFGLKLEEGRKFEGEDFILNPYKPIPVILGANYKNDYEIGDNIYISFVFSESEAQIVGFLEEGTNIYYRNKYMNLDRYVIMPIFSNDDYEGKQIYNFSVNHFYSLRNSGVLVSKLAVEDVQEIITDYSEKAGFENGYYVTEYDSTSKENFDLGIEMIYLIINIITVMVIVSIIFMASGCVLNRINRNKKYYSILLLNGCCRREIITIIISELLIVFIIAYLLSVLVLSIIIGIYGNLLKEICMIVGIGTLFFMIILSLIAIIVFFRCDLISYMKEEIEYAGSK